MPLEDYKPYLSNLVTGLAGGAVGGGLTYLNSKPHDGEGEDDFSKRRWTNTATGALAGAAVGAAAPTVYNAAKGLLDSDEGVAGKAIGMINPARHPFTTAPVMGAAGGAIAGRAVGRMAQGNPVGALTGSPAPLDAHLTGLEGKVTSATGAFDAAKANLQAQVDSATKTLKTMVDKAGAPLPGYTQADILKVQGDLRNSQQGLQKLLTDATAPERAAITAAEAAHTNFKGLVDADKAVPWWKKILPSAEERALLHAGAPKNFRYQRMGARVGGVAGAGLAPIISYYLGQ